MHRRLFRLLPWLAILCVGCSSTRPEVFTAEAFDPTSPFERRFVGSAASVCEAARRTLLSQGYLPSSGVDRLVTAVKSFQPTEDAHMTIEFTVSCVESDASVATAYANAVQTRFELRTTPTSYGLSAPIIGALSLPLGNRAESLVKTGAATVTDTAFYDRFWSLMALHAEPELPDSGDGAAVRH